MKAAIAIVAGLLALTACGTGQAVSQGQTVSQGQAEKPPTNEEVMALFDRWNAALDTRDPATVAAQYAPDAVLLPTVAGHIHDTREEITEYFTEFLKLSPHGTFLEHHVRVLDPDAAVLSGLYDFSITRDGVPETVHARGTFVFERHAGSWSIVEHHSSKVPA
jgi:uncharacterized protein (TIGR02246 family)